MSNTSGLSPRLKQQELIGYAQGIAKYYHVKLDFTERSIKKVEAILAKVRKEYRPTANSGDDTKYDMQGIALEMGAYIVDVIERAHGEGVWERDHPAIGKETWPFTYRNLTIFPVEWCLKQIYNGKVDSVAYKYKHAFLDKLPQ